MLTNLSSISNTSKKQERQYKQTGSLLALLDSDVKNAIQFFKKVGLFLKFLKYLLNANKVVINFIKADSKIIKLEIYKKAIRDFVHKSYQKKIIWIELKTIYLNNT